MTVSMSGLFFTLLGLAASTSLHCSARREINPCTCRQDFMNQPVINPVQPADTVAAATKANNNAGGNEGDGGGGDGGRGSYYGERAEVLCEKLKSFEEVANALRGKFAPEQQVTLRVKHSNLRDISRHDFKELHMSINRLELNHDNLGVVDGNVFTGLGRMNYLSLADNEIPSVPFHILSHLTLLKTLDLSRNWITRIDLDDFKFNPMLQSLFMAGNQVTEMIPGSFPPLTRYLALGRNHLKTLNHTLRDLNQLEWLFINTNELTSLDGELPSSGHNLKMMYAAENKITHLPAEFRYLHRLESLYLQHNKIRNLGGTLKKMRCLKSLEVSYNELQKLNPDDFVEAEMLEELHLGYNSLKFLGDMGGDKNGSSALYPLKSLKLLNLTSNEFREFSLASLRGLRELKTLILSNNRMTRLRGRPSSENLVDEEGEEIAGRSIQKMCLEFNELRSLDGSLFFGMKELQVLNLSYNALGPTIGPRDLSGLDGLRVLDISYNQITTLEDTSGTWLPSLERLIASHNRLVTLSGRDFRGFPVLCLADVSTNQIRTLMPELVTNTRCTIHGVSDVLRIDLQDNPVLCDAGLADLTVALEVNHVKVLGNGNDCATTTTSTPSIESTSAMSAELTSSLPPAPLPPLLIASKAAVSGGNVSFAATLE